MDYSLYCVEVAGALWELALYLVLTKVEVQSPVHALYRPVAAHDCPNIGVSAGRLLTYRRFSEELVPVDFLTVCDSYSMSVGWI